MPTTPQADAPQRSSASFASSVLTLGSATLLSQAIMVGTSPVITRLYAPDAFGLAAIFGAILAILAPICCLKYELAILLPREDANAASLFYLSLLILSATTLALALVILLAGDQLLAWFDAETLTPYKWLVPAGFLLVGMDRPLHYWNSRFRRFRAVGATEIASSSTRAVGQIAVGTLGFVSGLDLIFVQLVSRAVSPAWLGWSFWKQDRAFARLHRTRDELRFWAKRHAGFPRFFVWVGLLNVTSRNLPTLLLATYFGAETAGLFALARRIVVLPSRLVSSSTSQVLHQHAAKRHARAQDIGAPIERLIGRLLLLGIFPMIVLAFAAPDLFGLLFGARWAEAGRFVRALAPWVLSVFVISPLSVLWSVMERQRAALVYNVVLFGAQFGVITFGGTVLRDPVATLLLFSAVGVVGNLCVLGFFGSLTRVRWHRIGADALRWSAAAGICAAPPIVAHSVLMASWQLLVAAWGLAGLLYLGLVLWQDAEIRGAVGKILARILRR